MYIYIYSHTHTHTQVPFFSIGAPEIVSGMSGESEAKIREVRACVRVCVFLLACVCVCVCVSV
jgi:SpoVK/Ycf46/Vps4 family AAA+-type ATPase